MTPKKKKLSPAQKLALQDLRKHGGGTAIIVSPTMNSLRRAGYVIVNTITPAGHEALVEAEKPRAAIPTHGGNDVVYTPDPLARAIVEHFKPRGTILEPFAGGGAFVRAFHAYNEAHTQRSEPREWTGPGLITTVEAPLSVIDSMEIAPPDGSPGTDFFKDKPPLIAYDWIITNHPWSLTEETLKESMWLAPDIVLLCYIGSIFTDMRQKLIEDAGFVVAELAKVDRPKVWGSMGMQLAAMHLRQRSVTPPGIDPDFCRMSRIHYDNPDPKK